jgi:hypothetical protein
MPGAGKVRIRTTKLTELQIDEDKQRDVPQWAILLKPGTQTSDRLGQ